MTKRIILIITCLLVLVALVFIPSNDVRKDRIRVKIYPTKDKTSPTGVYIPKDLEECFRELETMLPPSLIMRIKLGPEGNMIKYHHGLGMWIRNYWGLWQGSRLATYFNDLGIFHPDDMSGIILDSFWRHLNDSPTKLQEQIELYKRYWDIINKQIEGYQINRLLHRKERLVS